MPFSILIQHTNAGLLIGLKQGASTGCFGSVGICACATVALGSVGGGLVAASQWFRMVEIHLGSHTLAFCYKVAGGDATL